MKVSGPESIYVTKLTVFSYNLQNALFCQIITKTVDKVDPLEDGLS